MSPLTLLFGSFVLLILVGVPISFALGLAALLVLLTEHLPLAVAVQQMFNGLNAFTLLAIPFFFLAGNVMNAGGISERLVRMAMALVGHIRGGLAHVNIVVGMFFAGISGSSTAEAAGIGTLFIPAMKRRGYDEIFTVALTACTSTMGVVIPPSILMVIYGATAGVSTGALLIGGIVPGVLTGLALMTEAYVYALRYGFPKESEQWLGLRELWEGIKEGIWPAGIPLIIVGGMMGGVFTATEAAAVAAVYAVGITVLLYRTLPVRAFPRILAETAVQVALVLLCVATASIFGWILALQQVPTLVADFILARTQSPTVIMLLVVGLFILLGTFMDAVPALLIFVPIIQPVALKVGIHPVHLGVVVVMTLALGLVTLPYGLCSLTACAVAGIPVTRILKTLHILMIAIFLIILLCAFVPWFVMIIPRLLVPKWL